MLAGGQKMLVEYHRYSQGKLYDSRLPKVLQWGQKMIVE